MIAWKIEAVQVNPTDTSKAVAHWRIIGEDGNTLSDPISGGTMPNAATVYGTQVIEVLVKATTTESDVIAAVQDAMGAEGVAELEESVEKQLAAQLNPPVVTVTFNDDGSIKANAKVA